MIFKSKNDVLVNKKTWSRSARYNKKKNDTACSVLEDYYSKLVIVEDFASICSLNRFPPKI